MLFTSTKQVVTVTRLVNHTDSMRGVTTGYTIAGDVIVLTKLALLVGLNLPTSGLPERHVNHYTTVIKMFIITNSLRAIYDQFSMPPQLN